MLMIGPGVKHQGVQLECDALVVSNTLLWRECWQVPPWPSLLWKKRRTFCHLPIWAVVAEVALYFNSFPLMVKEGAFERPKPPASNTQSGVGSSGRMATSMGRINQRRQPQYCPGNELN